MATVTIERGSSPFGLVLCNIGREAASRVVAECTRRGYVTRVDLYDGAPDEERCGYCGGEGFTVEGDESGTWHVPCPVCTEVDR